MGKSVSNLCKLANYTPDQIVNSPNPQAAYGGLDAAGKTGFQQYWNNLSSNAAAKDVMGTVATAGGAGLLGYGLYKYLQDKKKPSAIKMAGFVDTALGVGGDLVGGAMSGIGQGIKAVGDFVTPERAPNLSLFQNPKFTVPVGVGVPLAAYAAWKLRNHINQNAVVKPKNDELNRAKQEFEAALAAERSQSVKSAALQATLQLIEELEKKAFLGSEYVESAYAPLAILGALGMGTATYNVLKNRDPARLAYQAKTDAMQRYRTLHRPAIEVAALQPGEKPSDVESLSDPDSKVVTLNPPSRQSNVLNMPSDVFSKAACYEELQRDAAAMGITLDDVVQVWNNVFTSDMKFACIAGMDKSANWMNGDTLPGMEDLRNWGHILNARGFDPAAIDQATNEATRMSQQTHAHDPTPFGEQKLAGVSDINSRAVTYTKMLQDPYIAGMAEKLLARQGEKMTVPAVIDALKNFPEVAVGKIDHLLASAPKEMQEAFMGGIQKADPNYQNPEINQQAAADNGKLQALQQSVDQREQAIAKGQKLNPADEQTLLNDKQQLAQLQQQQQQGQATSGGGGVMDTMKGLAGKVWDFLQHLSGGQMAGIAAALGGLAMGHPLVGLIAGAALFFGADKLSELFAAKGAPLPAEAQKTLGQATQAQGEALGSAAAPATPEGAAQSPLGAAAGPAQAGPSGQASGQVSGNTANPVQGLQQSLSDASGGKIQAPKPVTGGLTGMTNPPQELLPPTTSTGAQGATGASGAEGAPSMPQTATKQDLYTQAIQGYQNRLTNPGTFTNPSTGQTVNPDEAQAQLKSLQQTRDAQTGQLSNLTQQANTASANIYGKYADPNDPNRAVNKNQLHDTVNQGHSLQSNLGDINKQIGFLENGISENTGQHAIDNRMADQAALQRLRTNQPNPPAQPPVQAPVQAPATQAAAVKAPAVQGIQNQVSHTPAPTAPALQAPKPAPQIKTPLQGMSSNLHSLAKAPVMAASANPANFSTSPLKV